MKSISVITLKIMIGDGDYGDSKSKYMIRVKDVLTAFEKMDHNQAGRTLPIFLLFN